MQDLAGAGQTVLGNRVPDSGTAGRIAMSGGALATGFYQPAIPLGLLGGAAAYTPQIQGLLGAAVSARPQSAQAIAEALKKSAPALGSTGGLLGLQFLNQ